MSTGSGELKLRIGAGSRSGGPATTALARLDDDFAGLGGGMRGTRAGAAPAVVAALDGTLTVGLDEVLAIEWGEVVEFVRAEDLERDERFETTVVDGVLTVTPRRSAPPSTRSTRAGLAIRRTWLAPIVQRGVGELAKELEEKQLSGDERVLIVERDGTLTPCEGPKDRHWGKAGDVLVLIHGTASSTRGSFGELLSSPAWPTVWDRFGGRVAALQHRTLTRDPFQNALTLMKALPTRPVSLQVLTHSRGGLVADALLWATDVGANGAGGVEDVSNTAVALAREADRRPSGGAVTVDSMVRVACPARGTPILSERLDRFLTLLFNVGRLAANAAAGPLAGAVVKAFGQVVVAAAKARERLDVLPGLAAMIPGSDVVSLLNGPPRSGQLSPSKLVVVAGDLEPSGMKMVALDLVASGALFRGREHDLVVPVASMSGGILRTERSRFLRRGARVHHLTYFENDDSRAFIAATLRGERPTGALPLVAGAGEGAERSAWGKLPWTELAALEPGAVGGPLVFIIPGIAGSGLRDDSRPGKPRVVWGDLNTVGVVLNPSVLSPSKDLTPIADCQVTRYFYGDASTKLSSKAKVVLFAYDWRRSVVDAGGILADVIRSRPTTGEKIFLVAHSMGGLVARAAIHALGAEWDERVAAGARLVQLGTPNEGSWLAPQLVSGDAEIVDGPLGVALSKVLKRVLSEMDGVYDLMPPKAEDEAPWRALGVARPDLHRVSGALARRSAELFALPTQNPAWVLRIAGTGVTPTFTGSRFGEAKRSEGDHRVLHAQLAPGGESQLPIAAVEHGSLLRDGPVLDAVGSFLAGEVVVPGPLEQGRRGTSGGGDADDGVVVEPVLQPESDGEIAMMLLGAAPSGPAKRRVTAAPIDVSVTHGDIAFARHTVLIGRFAGDRVSGAERVIDALRLGGALTAAYEDEVLPSAAGAVDAWRPTAGDIVAGSDHAVVVVGLGARADLTPRRIRDAAYVGLARAVRESVPGDDKQVGVSAVLIGAGSAEPYAVEDAVRAILEAASALNESVLEHGRDVTIGRIELVEYYQPRATQALRAAMDIAASDPARFVVASPPASKDPDAVPATSTPACEVGYGGVQRWERDRDDTSRYRRVGVQWSSESSLLYTFDVRRASTRAQTVDLPPGGVELLTGPHSDLLGADGGNAQIVRSLVASPHLNDLLTGDFGLELELSDARAASIPWEQLLARAPRAEPVSVSAGLVRQLRVRSDASQPITTEKNALVIAVAASGLSAVAAEAAAVAAALRRANFQLTICDAYTREDVLRELYSRDWQVIHICGHGFVDHAGPGASGVVLGDGKMLGGTAFARLERKPTLVFVNCCSLGDTRLDVPELSEAQRTAAVTSGGIYENPLGAATFAEQLMASGVVLAVVAAREVSDQPAADLAAHFYRELADGSAFGDAMRSARAAQFEVDPRTALAYQAYGDPWERLPGVRRGSTGARARGATDSVREGVEALEDLNARAAVRYGLVREQTPSERGVIIERLGVSRRAPAVVVAAAKLATTLGEIGDAVLLLRHVCALPASEAVEATCVLARLLAEVAIISSVAEPEVVLDARPASWSREIVELAAEPQTLGATLREAVDKLKKLADVGVIAHEHVATKALAEVALELASESTSLRGVARTALDAFAGLEQRADLEPALVGAAALDEARIDALLWRAALAVGAGEVNDIDAAAKQAAELGSPAGASLSSRLGLDTIADLLEIAGRGPGGPAAAAGRQAQLTPAMERRSLAALRLTERLLHARATAGPVSAGNAPRLAVVGSGRGRQS